jgi:hypothetical protein
MPCSENERTRPSFEIDGTQARDSPKMSRSSRKI